MGHQDNKLLSLISAVLAIVGVVLLLSVFAGIWNYSVGPTIYLASGAAGLFGAITGFVARRSGPNGMNQAGLWLGLVVIVAVVLMALWFTPAAIETTSPV